MLLRLEIENYGLIERAGIEFARGATIFTGETGSGKTMILGALASALGARASADEVRRGSSSARVSLAFDPDDRLRARLDADGFTLDPGEEATIAREISDAGKSSLRLNGRAATAGYVREIAEQIAEIVGQHDAQRLLAPSYHLEVLDRFGGPGAIAARDAVSAAHLRAAHCRRDLDTLQSDERSAARRYEDERFAMEEIEAAAPQPGEDERLSERRRYLDNVERIAASLRGAHEALAGDDDGASGSVGAAASALAQLREMSPDLRTMAGEASALQSEITDLAVRVSRELDATEFDPAELEATSARLDVIDRLKRKYGNTIEALLAHAEEARALVNAFEARGERAAELQAALRAAVRDLNDAAAALTKIRMAAAKRLRSGVVAEFKELALASGRFDAEFEIVDPPGPSGAQIVQFVFAANAGEPLRPLSRVASGGELSRVLLALVVVLAAARDRTALVFDEIDAGIGGATAVAVGTRVGRLASEGQVLCVTHLAQLATWADRHYVLEKQEKRSGTTIAVREIDGDESRAAELARMLSGEPHAVALEHARTMLRQRRGQPIAR
jgi:DNA repair protein RecN (Recombination protein N)